MRSPAASPSMIGRESDMEALGGELTAVADGRPRVVVVGGEAGIGKSRLVTEFTAHAESSALVLTGRCVDVGQDGAPYAPFTQILRRLIDVLGADALLDAAGPSAGVLSVLLPELDDAEAVPGRSGAERLYELITVLFENISAEQPVMVVIEDIHWADAATLELLRFLIRMMDRGRLLLLLTYRTDEVLRGHPLRGYLGELDRTRRATRWELGRLGRAQVAEQAEQILGCPADPATVDRVYALSEGVPFFVEELIGIDHLRGGEELPETLRELLLARYERLPEPTQRLLRLIAAGGLCVEHDLLEAVFDGTPDELDVSAREAVLANVLAADSTEYSFRHALVREAIHADLLPGERARFHSRYARALEAAPDRSAAELSYHWLAAHDVRRAFVATLDAMEQAHLSYAYRTAAAMGDRALELWDSIPDAESLAGRSRIELLSRTASALRNAGDSDRALALVNVALGDTGELAPQMHARLLRDKAQYLANLSRPGSTELLREALALVPKDPSESLRPQLLAELAGRLMLEARFDEAVQTSTAAIAEAGDGGRARRSVAHTVRGTVRVAQGDIGGGLDDLDRGRELAAEDAGPLLRNAVNASDVMNMLGRFTEAVRIAEHGADQARQRGVERTSGVMLASNTVEPLLALGRLDQAEAMLDPALALDPPPGFRVHLQRMKLWLTLWRGDVDGADGLLRRWRSGMLVQAEIEMQSRLGFARIAAEIAIAHGDPARAWEEARVVTSDLRRSIPAYDLPLLAVAARALTDLAAGAPNPSDPGVAEESVRIGDEAARIEAVLEELSGWSTTPVWGPLVRAELAGARATASRSRRDPAEAALLADAWRRAADAAERPEAPAHLRPYALLRRGQSALAAGDRPAAEAALAESRAGAAETGFGLIVAQADRLLRDSGAVRPAGSHERRHDTALTEREAQVLDLIEQGLTNKQIGERLYISAKTASVHVSSILRKVGAASRTEAVYRAARSRS
ncbi:MAG TPA: AAA family ATPase [Leifsonia sp.]